jgi:hypothetical protein
MQHEFLVCYILGSKHMKTLVSAKGYLQAPIRIVRNMLFEKLEVIVMAVREVEIRLILDHVIACASKC